MKKLALAALMLSSTVLLQVFSCAGANEEKTEKTVSEPEYKTAIAVLHPTEGNEVQGVVTFTKVATGIKVTADVSGLAPGKHGFHVHEYGDCSAANATSAGGHFNPFGMPHGAPTSDQRHVGDLGNLSADSTGVAHYERIDTMLRLNGPNSIIGRGLIVHGGEDDLVSQPTGNAGPRVACGVIGIAKEEGGE
jgi:Cu-Zn family superoxide dismutase